VVNPAEQVTQDLPIAWSTAEPATADLGQPFLTGLEILFNDEDLKRLVDEAMQSNPDINQLAQQVQASGMLLRQLDASRSPQIDLVADANRNKTFNTIANSYTFGLNLAWEIDLWGRLANLSDAAQLNHRASESELTAVRTAIAMAVARTWIEGWTIYHQLEIEKRYVERLQHMVIIVTQSFREGSAALEDLTAIRIQQETAMANIAASQERLTRNQRAMAVLLGKVPNQTDIFSSNNLPDVTAPPQQLPASVIANRLDIQAAFYRLGAMDAEMKASYKALLPSLSLSGAYNRNNQPGSLFDNDISWSLIGGLTQPLFRWGALRAEAEASVANREASWWAYRKTVLVALQEVENALAMETSLQLQSERLDRAHRDVAAFLESYEGKYRSGLIDILDLLDVQVQALEIDVQRIQIQASQLDNRLLLAQALGYRMENHRYDP
jgi:NodT family efflux transporter outer membrane factor (OMF) lipoprotein